MSNNSIGVLFNDDTKIIFKTTHQQPSLDNNEKLVLNQQYSNNNSVTEEGR